MQNNGQKYKRQPRWNKYEVVLLLDTFINIENGKNRQAAINVVRRVVWFCQFDYFFF